MDDLMDILGLKDLQESSEREEQIRSIQERSDLKRVMDSPEGRRVLWRIMAYAGTFRPSFSSDNNVMAFNEGARRVGIELNKWIMGVNPLMFSKMQAEMYALAKQEEKEREARKKGGTKK
jgi:hypothetical protein